MTTPRLPRRGMILSAQQHFRIVPQARGIPLIPPLTPSTDVTLPTGLATTVLALTADWIVPHPFEVAGVWIAGINWSVTAAGGAGATARLELAIEKNGTEINRAAGVTQPVDAIGGPFQDVITNLIPTPDALPEAAGRSWERGDLVEARVEVVGVAPGAAGTATIQINHGDGQQEGPALGLDFVIGDEGP